MLDSGTSVLHAELVAEQAASLGIAGRKVAEAVSALQAMAPEVPGDAERLNSAAEAVYQYFVQRELNGLVDHNDAIAHYAIGPEVLARIGKMTRPL
ncbi:DUF6665 family protein [uncultured Tateyamaria sp.]|uniref:DUF6665 family protein n=1 Tax=uncultured Tateyamaria sp. TaxID=455651 RepID=UPI00345C6F35